MSLSENEFLAVVEAKNDFFLTLATNRLGSEQLAEEVVQETWKALWE